MKKADLLYEHISHADPTAPAKSGAERRILSRTPASCTNSVCLFDERGELLLWRMEIAKHTPRLKISGRREDALNLYFVTGGKGQLEELSLSIGDCVFVAPLQAHSLEADANEPWTLVRLTLSGSYEAVLQRYRESGVPLQKIHFSEPKAFLKLAEALLFCPPAEDAERFAVGASDTLIAFLRREELPEAVSTLSRKESFVKRAVDYIGEHLADVTVNRLAAELSLDRRYFSQIFREVMHTSPQEYIQARKMDWVRTALISSDLSINEIVDAIGYGHRNSLALAFQKQFGCSPSLYREKYRE